ncbi:MAG: hypothetical protein ACRD2P_08945 [Terriglobia bacterium]
MRSLSYDYRRHQQQNQFVGEDPIDKMIQGQNLADRSQAEDIFRQWHLENVKRDKEQARWRAVELLRLFGNDAHLTPKERAVWKAYCVDRKSAREVEVETGASKSSIEAVARRATIKLSKSMKRVRSSGVKTAEQQRVIAYLEDLTEEHDC